MNTNVIIAHIGYLISICFFILGIKRMAQVRTCRSANIMAGIGMLLAIISQLIELGTFTWVNVLIGILIGAAIGLYIARTVQMTEMPEMVGALNGFGGAGSALVATSVFAGAPAIGLLGEMNLGGFKGIDTAITVVLSVIIGWLTFSGSFVAYLKLSGKGGKKFDQPILLPGRHYILGGLLFAAAILGYCWIALTTSPLASIIVALLLSIVSLCIGVMAVIAIGGADMPVVISLLNSYSGLAGAATGFVLNSPVLIVTGSLVGASGIILTKIMCKAMNRSLANVIFGGFGSVAVVSTESKGDSEYKNVKQSDVEEASLDFDAARDVIIVPGYGLAVAQGQSAVADLAAHLEKRGCKVRYAIHPVAGRMPGHMNVLLAEAKVPYESLYEMDSINDDFKNADIVLVVGANDVVNPAAKEDSTSPLYGMPVLNVEEAKQVFVIKRSLASGFAGIKNILFEKDNCRMIFGDAKKVIEQLLAQIATA